MQRSDYESQLAPISDDSSQSAEPGSQLRSEPRDLNPVRAALRQAPLFSDMTDAAIDDLTTAASLVDCAKNSFVFRHGDPGDSLFVIVSGVIDISIERDAAQPFTLCTLRSGEFFGEMSLFDASERSADARAVVDARLLRVDR